VQASATWIETLGSSGQTVKRSAQSVWTACITRFAEGLWELRSNIGKMKPVAARGSIHLSCGFRDRRRRRLSEGEHREGGTLRQNKEDSGRLRGVSADLTARRDRHLPDASKAGQAQNRRPGKRRQGKLGQGKLGQGKLGQGKLGRGKLGRGKLGRAGALSAQAATVAPPAHRSRPRLSAFATSEAANLPVLARSPCSRA
jgi:hypothetical protein